MELGKFAAAAAAAAAVCGRSEDVDVLLHKRMRP
jgi:hypothetical protein